MLKPFIPQSPDEVKRLCKLNASQDMSATFLVIGVIANRIPFEVPLVVDPDVNNDAHWQEYADPAAATGVWELNADQLSLTIDGAVGMIRINKPAGDNIAIQLTRRNNLV